MEDKERAMAMGADCENCPLKDEPIVYGSGPDEARYVVVGEAPGAKEIRSGVPFIGPSGRLLDKVLTHHDIDRDEIYITNTVLCRPPLKDGKNTPPKAPAIKACRQRLITEIKAHVPEGVLALGAPASKTLLNSKAGINDLRVGGAKHSDELDLPVVATFHPAAALRNPDNFPSIIADVGKLKETFVGKIVWEPPTVDVVDDWTESQYTLSLAVQHPLVVLDIENAPPFNRHHPDLLCIGMTHKEGHAYVYTKRICDDLRFRRLLDRAFNNTRWGFQNGKYDIQHLWGAGISNAHVDEDSMLAHYATDERKRTHSLEQLATEFLGAPNYKTEAKLGLDEDEDLSHLPPDLLYKYNGTDTDSTFKLLPILRKEMVNDDVLSVYERFLIPGANALAKAEYLGIRVDEAYLDALDEELSALLVDKEAETAKWVANPRSPKQIQKAFGEILSEDFESSTNKLALTMMIERDPMSEEADLARAILSYRESHKEHSTYVIGMKKRLQGGRIHAQFNLHIAETGRLSSSKPNMQNIKAGRLRNMFIPDDGHVLLSADYSAIELRIAAVFFKSLGDPWLFEQFANNRPLHKEMAARLFGPDYTERQYVQGKTTTFSILFEVGAPSLAARLRIPIKQGQRLIDGWKANVPGLEKYWEMVRDDIVAHGFLRSFYGRVRRFWLITHENKHEVFKQGYNFPIQSPASDICLDSLIELSPVTTPVVTVHDSITFQIPNDELAFQQKLIQKTMEDVPDWPIHFPVEMKVGDRWT